LSPGWGFLMSLRKSRKKTCRRVGSRRSWTWWLEHQRVRWQTGRYSRS